MGISIRGTRALNLRVSADALAAEGDASSRGLTQSAGDVYVTNPAVIFHAQSTDFATYDDRVVAVMARFLITQGEHAEFNDALAADPSAALHISQLLVEAVAQTPLRLPTLAEVLAEEERVCKADAAERRAAAAGSLVPYLPFAGAGAGAGAGVEMLQPAHSVPYLLHIKPKYSIFPETWPHHLSVAEQVAATVADADAAGLLCAFLVPFSLDHAPGCAAAALKAAAGAGGACAAAPSCTAAAVDAAAAALCASCLEVLTARVHLAQLAGLGLPSSAEERDAAAAARSQLDKLSLPVRRAVVSLAALPDMVPLRDERTKAALVKVAFASVPLAAQACSLGRVELLRHCLDAGADASCEFVASIKPRKNALETCTPLLSSCDKSCYEDSPPPAPSSWLSAALAQVEEKRVRAGVESAARAKCVRLLLQNGASVSAARTPTMPGTPLTVAGWYKWKEVWLLLVREGANLEEKNSGGETAWDTILHLLRHSPSEREAEKQRLLQEIASNAEAQERGAGRM